MTEGLGLAVAAVLAIAFLAFANGANDNGKGVATLVGSGALREKRGLLLGLLATLAGSLASIVWARGLVRAFSGQGLVPDALAGQPAFLLSVAGGAALTVLLATRLGLPVSTTHALLGALVGAGLVFADGAISTRTLGGQFVLPLLASPLLAGVVTLGFFPLARRLSRFSNGGGSPRLAADDPCLCVGEPEAIVVPAGARATAAIPAGVPLVSVGTVASCASGPPAALALAFPLARLRASLARALHLSSGALLSFARGLNDTPKIAAIGVATAGLSGGTAAAVAAATMALGGSIAVRRVTRTMSRRITGIREDEGLAASLTSGLLVLGASRLGLPVSTTHVACGALFGVGAREGKARWWMVGRIAGAWVATLPLSLAISATLALLVRTWNLGPALP